MDFYSHSNSHPSADSHAIEIDSQIPTTTTPSMPLDYSIYATPFQQPDIFGAINSFPAFPTGPATSELPPHTAATTTAPTANPPFPSPPPAAIKSQSPGAPGHTPPGQWSNMSVGAVRGYQEMTPPGTHVLNMAVPGSSGVDSGLSPEDNMRSQGGSASDGEDSLPAKDRRKAQNRAAQRAFRERKERHVKDLEEKLASLEESAKATATENAALKRNYERISIENQILRATGEAIAQTHSHSHPPTGTPESAAEIGPQRYNPEPFFTNMLAGHANQTRSHRIVTTETGERLLAAAATWDYIVSHNSFQRGLVNPQDVSDLLKGQARCDGQGPVFREIDVEKAILACQRDDDDEML